MTARIGKSAGFRSPRMYFKEWRKFRKLTLEQIGELMGSDKSGASKQERGENDFSGITLAAWAHACSCSPADLFRSPTAMVARPLSDDEKELIAETLCVADRYRDYLQGLPGEEVERVTARALELRRGVPPLGNPLLRGPAIPHTDPKATRKRPRR